MLDAVLELLDDASYGPLSLEAVGRCARVSRPSLYRRRPSEAAVVLDASAQVAGTDPAPATG